MIRFLPFVIEIALLVFCLIDCIQTDSLLVRNLPKPVWVILIILVPLVGGIAWLVAGRPTSEQRPRSVPWPATQTAGFPEYERPRPAAPDDDPPFLEGLDRADAGGTRSCSVSGRRTCVAASSGCARRTQARATRGSTHRPARPPRRAGVGRVTLGEADRSAVSGAQVVPTGRERRPSASTLTVLSCMSALLRHEFHDVATIHAEALCGVASLHRGELGRMPQLHPRVLRGMPCAECCFADEGAVDRLLMVGDVSVSQTGVLVAVPGV